MLYHGTINNFFFIIICHELNWFHEEVSVCGEANIDGRIDRGFTLSIN